MIELDKRLSKVSNVINKCYETLFPNFPRFPQFTFTRAMLTIWLEFVYKKLENKLFDAFTILFKEVSNNRIRNYLIQPSASHFISLLLNTKTQSTMSAEKRQELTKELLLSRYYLSLYS
jgi:hypothetical protein